jgi:hypothetical protein
MGNNKEWLDEIVGQYHNHEYRVKLLRGGWRCGYVRINPDDNTCIYDIDVHGGITYSRDSENSYLPDGWWVGFDCIHSGDEKDVNAVKEVFGYDIECDGYGVVRSAEYVENECKKLIDQL